MREMVGLVWWVDVLLDGRDGVGGALVFGGGIDMVRVYVIE